MCVRDGERERTWAATDTSDTRTTSREAPSPPVENQETESENPVLIFTDLMRERQQWEHLSLGNIRREVLSKGVFEASPAVSLMGNNLQGSSHPITQPHHAQRPSCVVKYSRIQESC